jgi:LytS/YehU family sensor histidine kinase
MDKDIELSKIYLNKFAEVYRVILKTEYSDLTTLQEELKLIEAYVYLIQIRFKDSVFFHFQVEQEDFNKALPPLSVQMLIENAIKHNVATTADPINIKVYSNSGFLIIENERRKKKYLPTERKATGIANITKRYEFFTDKKVEVVESQDKFIVKLPLIEIEYGD